MGFSLPKFLKICELGNHTHSYRLMLCLKPPKFTHELFDFCDGLSLVATLSIISIQCPIEEDSAINLIICL